MRLYSILSGTQHVGWFQRCRSVTRHQDVLMKVTAGEADVGQAKAASSKAASKEAYGTRDLHKLIAPCRPLKNFATRLRLLKQRRPVRSRKVRALIPP